MIGWEDVYKVVVAMVPLYVALMLGYGSVKWWHLFTAEQCDAISRLVCYFTLPLFTFEFTAHVDPFHMNYPFIAADAISKLVIVAVLAFWAKCCSSSSSKGSYCWSITAFSLSTLTNSLVVGVPLIKAMYGDMAVHLVVQSSVLQAILWLTGLLFVLEFRRTSTSTTATPTDTATATATATHHHHHLPRSESDDATPPPTALRLHSPHHHHDLDLDLDLDLESNHPPSSSSFWCLMKAVWLKLAMNPNSYACVVGLTWAFLSNRWHFQMPSILEGSILIMSRAGTGTAMFSMGLFMALQKKVISCGPSLTLFGMVLRFIAGPTAMAIGSIAVGLHGDVLRVAIIQAALPQSITSFIFAKEYGLHANVLSTAVIFGMMVSLPVLIVYYAVLEFLH